MGKWVTVKKENYEEKSLMPQEVERKNDGTGTQQGPVSLRKAVRNKGMETESKITMPAHGLFSFAF